MKDRLETFAPEDAKLAEQKKPIERSETGFEERNVLPTCSPGDGDEVRDEFVGVGENSFAEILVGKGGAEKARSGSPVAPEELFRRMGVATMRKRETRRREMERGDS